MADLNSILLAVAVIGIYSLIVLVLWKLKYLEKYNFTPWAGPILMWKTKRGKKFLDSLATRKRFWEWFGNISVVIAIISMFFITALLVWSVSKVNMIPKEKAPSPELLLGIPGINPVIPVFYGIIGLVVAIVFHELAHGVLARVAGLEVKSVGILLFVFPIGAFVEPDEEELLKISRLKRSRVLAGGPAANLIIAFFALLVFSLALAPAMEPRAYGIGIVGIEKNSPASNTSLQPYDILVSLNGTNVTNYSEFKEALNLTKPGDTVAIAFYSRARNAIVTENITIGNRYNFIQEEENKGKPYLGVTILPLDLVSFKDQLANPFRGGVTGFLTFLSLPFLGLSPLDAGIGSFYVINSPLGPDAFFLLLNIFYWIFWINLMVGLTNTLPSLPLDAGYLVRDGLYILVGRTKTGKEKTERIVKYVMIGIGLLVLFMILFQIIGPRIFGT
ncbi:MAG: site-2 protease family protein [Thermoplasmata archaeon]|nr:site-2 protease family protein [Thermoplasmata archaeon]